MHFQQTRKSSANLTKLENEMALKTTRFFKLCNEVVALALIAPNNNIQKST